jgi:hypothetical protein
MPKYQVFGQNTPIKLLQRGIPAYAYGSKMNTPSFWMAITSVAVASNLVTIGVILRQGLLPNDPTVLVGEKIYVSGTSTDSGGANTPQTGGTITSVSINKTTGVGTITYSNTASNQSVTADAGQATILPPDVGESISGPSQAFAIQDTLGAGYGISWELRMTGTFSVQLEGAITNREGDYAAIGSAQSASGVFIAQVPNLVKFVRLNFASGSGVGVGKILLG